MNVRARRVGAVAIALALALVLASCWRPSAEPKFEVTVTSDVVYGQGAGSAGSIDLELDLYKPTVPSQERLPLMVLIHGGGFSGGDKAAGKWVTWANEWASRGYLVASINYRLMGDEPIPSARVQPLLDIVGTSDPQRVAAVAAIDDTLTALDHLQARPDVLVDKTVLNGGSAGAITALYTGYALDDVGITPSPVAAVISHWGGFAATPGDATALDGVAAGEGPVFLAHGTNDTVVPYSLTQDIVARAQVLGHPYEVHVQQGAGHGFDILTKEFSPGVTVLQAEVDWLNAVLYPD